MSIQRTISTAGRAAVRAGAIAIFLSAGLGCGSALDVPNPQAFGDDALNNTIILKNVTNGAEGVLQLSFDKGVGLTSGDHYTLYVNRSTHLLDKWDMMLEGKKPPPATSTWEQWTPIGPVKLALNHRLQGKPVEIRFDNVAVPETMDPSVFTNARVRG